MCEEPGWLSSIPQAVLLAGARCLLLGVFFRDGPRLLANQRSINWPQNHSEVTSGKGLIFKGVSNYIPSRIQLSNLYLYGLSSGDFSQTILTLQNEL